jgi:hypothetical protein
VKFSLVFVVCGETRNWVVFLLNFEYKNFTFVLFRKVLFYAEVWDICSSLRNCSE